ncbi:MAG TPA: hypothetical protein VHS53_16320 [Mucilaginibacter sp.]|jgi:hypothetical protein|nr:hypothetical protein [Mucilaginibacter sp.]
MEEVKIQGGSNFLRIIVEEAYGFPNQTCHAGGYDTRSLLEINCGAFTAKASLYLSTGELFKFYESLSDANEKLKGSVHFNNYEENLEFDIKYDVNGHILITGSFYAHDSFVSKLIFDFESDQSYIQSTIKQLNIIVNKYGGMTGIK